MIRARSIKKPVWHARMDCHLQCAWDEFRAFQVCLSLLLDVRCSIKSCAVKDSAWSQAHAAKDGAAPA